MSPVVLHALARRRHRRRNLDKDVGWPWAKNLPAGIEASEIEKPSTSLGLIRIRMDRLGAENAYGQLSAYLPDAPLPLP